MAEQVDWRSSHARQKIIDALESHSSNLSQTFKSFNSVDFENKIFSQSDSREGYMQQVTNVIQKLKQAKCAENGPGMMQQTGNMQELHNQKQMLLNQNSMMLSRNQGPMHHTAALQNQMQQNQLASNMQHNRLASNQMNNNNLQMGQQSQMIVGANVSQGGNLQQGGVGMQMMGGLQQGVTMQIGNNSGQHNLNIGQGQSIRAPMNPQQMSAMQQQQQPARSSFATFPPHQQGSSRHIIPQNRIQLIHQSGAPVNQMHQQSQLTMLMSNQPTNQILSNNQFSAMNHSAQMTRGQQPFNQGVLPAGSVASMTSPGGAGSHMIPSPAASNQQIPVSPVRIPMPSPGSSIQALGSQGNVALSSAEEQEYLQKWSQLQKYIDPLKRMIQQIDKDEDRKVDLNKMKNLLDILSDKTKRLPIQTLLRCEQVLEKQVDLNKQQIASLSINTSENFGQSLLETLEANAQQPMFKHILNQTFLASSLLIQTPSSPVKRKLCESKSDSSYEVSDLIQGEVARLHSRFSVSIHSLLHRSGSDCIVLQCTIDDINLPNVPPIVVILPSAYPSKSPTYQMPADHYESTAFFSKIKENLLKETSKNSGNYSLTALLNFWDLSIRKASTNTSL